MDMGWTVLQKKLHYVQKQDVRIAGITTSYAWSVKMTMATTLGHQTQNATVYQQCQPDSVSTQRPPL
jgi:hypothetical protein